MGEKNETIIEGMGKEKRRKKKMGTQESRKGDRIDKKET